jgi:hypothetical protein
LVFRTLQEKLENILTYKENCNTNRRLIIRLPTKHTENPASSKGAFNNYSPVDKYWPKTSWAGTQGNRQKEKRGWFSVGGFGMETSN